jgi:hypothetical protein
MKFIFQFIIGVLIFVWCLPILFISLLVALWEWNYKCTLNTETNVDKLITNIVDRD